MKAHRAPFVKVAWVLILLFVFGMAVLQAMPEKVEKGGSEDPTGLVMVQLQGDLKTNDLFRGAVPHQSGGALLFQEQKWWGFHERHKKSYQILFFQHLSYPLL